MDSSRLTPAMSRGNTKAPMSESARALAMRALRAVSKSAVSSLQLDEVREEILYGQELDLHRWTLVLTDKNMETLSQQRNADREYHLNSAAASLLGMFDGFSQPHSVKNGLIRLNISNAKAVTDYGITLIARESPALIALNISSCSKISDVGVREVGMNCTQLQELNISACPEIDGSGLSAIAECCRSLIKLNVSKCAAMQNWSLKKVFYECTRLEEVNLSHLPKVSDEEIRVLSQNCPHVVAVEAAECPYVSDSSIQSLAAHCIDLDLVDVSRTQMMYRITDVSMLALAQKSRSLRVLRLHGCDHVTDVGLTWLSEGCTTLEELDIGLCNKVTDAGLRSIGSACHSLTSIDISQARTVTDVGIASLSVGCPKLKHFILHGIFLLADPRLSAPKKGAKLEAWQAVIGVAAMSENCPEIEVLDLSGCFRLNIALHHYVARFCHLKVLNMAGCNQSSTDSLVSIARGCRLIEELNLSDCGKSVNVKSMQAFSMHCTGIRVLTLCRCINMSGGAIKAISLFQHLQKLDMTGCRNLTDNMMIHLSEVDKVPKLRTLSFVDIAPLTDSILAWISIKSHNILLIALKGTNISKKAVTSVRDRFPNSDLLMNDNFFGFWPKYRVDDRILLNKYHHMIDGLTRTQNRMRKVHAQRLVAGITFERKKYAAHCLLQRIARGYLGRCTVRSIREQIRLVNKAAVVITSIFRMAQAKNIAAERREYFHQLRMDALSMRIQLCWRKHRDYKKLQRLRWEYEKLQERREFGAIKMQSIARIYFARNRVTRIRQLNRSRADVANRKAIIIQRCYRGHAARRIAHVMKEIVRTLQAKRHAAAIRLQRKYRAYRTTSMISSAVAFRKLCNYRATQIQSVMRGALVRIHVAETKVEGLKQRRTNAAIKIQTRLRMLKAFIELMTLRIERDQRKASFDFAANIIIRAARKKLACIRANELRLQKRKRMKEQLLKEIAAVCKIQSLYRGVLGRMRFDKVLREKKGKWKELFDEKKGKRFFYNKLSGEVRWRMPQDLLDLIPHPTCDDCTVAEATVECAVCNELFCSNCWRRVHAGGRRQEHEFRSIYDYYGKRLDYGDGEFPSKWPTEVIQDEVQGWMLRVAPVRMPIKKYSTGWEEYVEDVQGKRLSKASWKPKTAPGEGRTFYFNRNTFETAYETPDDVRREQEEEEALRLQKEQEEQWQQQEQQQYYDPYGQSESGYYASDGSWVPTDYYGNPLSIDGTAASQQVELYGGSGYAPDNSSGAQYGYEAQPQSASSDYYNYNQQQVLPVTQLLEQGVEAENSFGDINNYDPQQQQQQQQQLVPYEMTPSNDNSYGYDYYAPASQASYSYDNGSYVNYDGSYGYSEQQGYDQQGYYDEYGQYQYYDYNYYPSQEDQQQVPLLENGTAIAEDGDDSMGRLLIEDAPETPRRNSAGNSTSDANGLDSISKSTIEPQYAANESPNVAGAGENSTEMSLKSRLRSSLASHDRRSKKGSVKFQ